MIPRVAAALGSLYMAPILRGGVSHSFMMQRAPGHRIDEDPRRSGARAMFLDPVPSGGRIRGSRSRTTTIAPSAGDDASPPDSSIAALKRAFSAKLAT